MEVSKRQSKGLVERGGYCYQGNCYEIFDKFFLQSNPFFDICDNQGIEVEGSIFGTAFGGMNQPKPARVSDVNVTAKVTLKEFLCGAHKIVHYNRQVVGLDGRTVKHEDATVEVVVKPGMLESAKLHYPGMGNQQPKMPATDLIVSFQLSSKDKYYSR